MYYNRCQLVVYPIGVNGDKDIIFEMRRPKTQGVPYLPSDWDDEPHTMESGNGDALPSHITGGGGVITVRVVTLRSARTLEEENSRTGGGEFHAVPVSGGD